MVATASASAPAQAIALVFGRRCAFAPTTNDVADAPNKVAFEPVAQRAHAGGVALQAWDGDLGRLAETDDPRDVLGAAAARAFLTSAVNHGGELETAPNVERSDAFGPVQLVGGERQEIDRATLEIDRRASRRLNRVRVEDRADGLRLLGESLDREDHARFVVGPHHRDERDARRKGRPKALTVETAAGQDRDDVSLDPAFGLELPDERQHGRMLDGGDDDFVAVRVRGQGGAYRRIVALRSAGGEQDLVSKGGSDERRRPVRGPS